MCSSDLPRDLWETAVERRVRPPTPMESLSGIEVRILDELDNDVVYVIDVRAMRENVHRMLFEHPLDEPFDPVAWKVQFGASLHG